MTKPIKAIRIDATARTLKEVQMEPGLEEFYRLIECRTIEAVYPQGIAPGDVLFVDEEGLLREPACADWFIWKGYPQALAGNGLVVGNDSEGESVSAVTGLATVRGLVRFISRQELLA